MPTPSRNTEISGSVNRQIGENHLISIRGLYTDRTIQNQGVGGFNLPEVGIPSSEGSGASDSERKAQDAAKQERVRELKRIYQDTENHYGLFLLTESLIDYDETFSMWRLRHIKMVERMIGTKAGTGGSEGAAYLKKTVDRTFFPELWELRSYLSTKSGG